jgi:hypothetical protein
MWFHTSTGATPFAVHVLEAKSAARSERPLERGQQGRVYGTRREPALRFDRVADQDALHEAPKLTHAIGRQGALDLPERALRARSEGDPRSGTHHRDREDQRDNLLSRKLGRDQNRTRIKSDASSPAALARDGKAKGSEGSEVAQNRPSGCAELVREIGDGRRALPPEKADERVTAAGSSHVPYSM